MFLFAHIKQMFFINFDELKAEFLKIFKKTQVIFQKILKNNGNINGFLTLFQYNDTNNSEISELNVINLNGIKKTYIVNYIYIIETFRNIFYFISLISNFNNNFKKIFEKNNNYNIINQKKLTIHMQNNSKKSNENQFKLVSRFLPSGDQPQAIEKLIQGLKLSKKNQVLLGVTGSGKTFTVANVINKINRPTLILSPNKTLASQLYTEMKNFFPLNAVEYFVSYYDYYKPESYIPKSDLYFEKVSSINNEIDRMRHAATVSLFERNDVIIVASVSAIYGISPPEVYEKMSIFISVGENYSIHELLRKFSKLEYNRNDILLERGNFRCRGDILEIFPAHYVDKYLRINFFGDQIEKISTIDSITNQRLSDLNIVSIFPNSHYVVSKNLVNDAIEKIKIELENRLNEFLLENKLVEHQRLKERVNFDLDMMSSTGSCSGIENYSRYFSGRNAGEPPPTLFEYLPKDALLIVDESHIAIPQLRAMYIGDQSRKETLSNFGFRLPSCKDNRPLKFAEWDKIRGRTIFVSATPGNWELSQIINNENKKLFQEKKIENNLKKLKNNEIQKNDLENYFEKSRKNNHDLIDGLEDIKNNSENFVFFDDSVLFENLQNFDKNDKTTYQDDEIIYQEIRPTGLLDPQCEVRKTSEQIDDLMAECRKTIEKSGRILITVLTKKMAEYLSEYLNESGFKAKYIHSEINTFERVEIINDLRIGKYDILIGINLLREGLDIPECQLVLILDADKEGYLRSKQSLIQTIGRAARNQNGKVIFYGDKITDSMKYAINETERRRKKQHEYNLKNNITPKTISKKIFDNPEDKKNNNTLSAEFIKNFDAKSVDDIFEIIKKKDVEMKDHAKKMNFEQAIKLRNEITELKKIIMEFE